MPAFPSVKDEGEMLTSCESAWEPPWKPNAKNMPLCEELEPICFSNIGQCELQLEEKNPKPTSLNI